MHVVPTLSYAVRGQCKAKQKAGEKAPGIRAFPDPDSLDGPVDGERQGKDHRQDDRRRRRYSDGLATETCNGASHQTGASGA